MQFYFQTFRQKIAMRPGVRKEHVTVASADADTLFVNVLRMSSKNRIAELYDDPIASAKAIGLHYMTDDASGIRRKRNGRHFSFIDPKGKVIRDKAVIRRIKALVIPPAWTDVWISPVSDSHLQATGRDIRGRKQYRYHTVWNQMRNMTKFHRMIPFAHLLPQVRKRIRRDLNLKGMQRQKVLAAVVQLLEKTLIRVGNEEYAKSNKSFGLTTLRNKHVTVKGNKVIFKFRGKSGVDHVIDVSDSRLARIIQRCQEISGQHLFDYKDDEGVRQKITSEDVNQYLREIMGEEYTAKDYRTWRGTVLMAKALSDGDMRTSDKHERKMITQAVKSVAEKLGNTPAVCRNYYVHPAIIYAYREGQLHRILGDLENLKQEVAALLPEETAVLRVLKEHQERLMAK